MSVIKEWWYYCICCPLRSAQRNKTSHHQAVKAPHKNRDWWDGTIEKTRGEKAAADSWCYSLCLALSPVTKPTYFYPRSGSTCCGELKISIQTRKITRPAPRGPWNAQYSHAEKRSQKFTRRWQLKSSFYLSGNKNKTEFTTLFSMTGQIWRWCGNGPSR